MKSNSPESAAGRDETSLPITASLWTALVVTAMFGAAHLTSPWGFACDLVGNLSYLAIWPLACIFLLAAVTGRRLVALGACLGGVVATLPLLTHLGAAVPRAAEGIQPVSLLLSNVQGDEAAWKRLRSSVIHKRRPDIIVLIEADPAVAESVAADAGLKESHPFSVTPQRGLGWPILILSRFPLKPFQAAGDRDRYRFLFSFRRASVVSLPFGEAILTAEHPPSPRTQAAWADGNQQLLLLGELVRQQFADTGLPLIVAGDFNTTPSGYRTRLLRDRLGLHADPLGVIPRGTWPSGCPAFFRLPLDRVWATAGVAFTSREVLENIGSDHRPVLVGITAAQQE
jgi:endonuclease/exonuclease/phosphatase (EEP) superfamily protein YafD